MWGIIYKWSWYINNMIVRGYYIDLYEIKSIFYNNK
jgi:hypothetical protein